MPYSDDQDTADIVGSAIKVSLDSIVAEILPEQLSALLDALADAEMRRPGDNVAGEGRAFQAQFRIGS